MHRTKTLIASAFISVCHAGYAGAQVIGGITIGPVITVSGDSAERVRENQLLTPGASQSYLLRSTSTLTRDPRERAGASFQLIAPAVWFVDNSDLPVGQNDGALWAGKAVNARALGGFDVGFGAIRLTVIPEAGYSSNDNFQYQQLFVTPLPATRNPFASPWNVFPYSIDAPPRFGYDKILRIAPGQSTLSAHIGSFEAGITSENEWWGPGIRNAILLSDNAEGFPRAFFRPYGPLATSIGKIDFRVTWGGLTESRFFDFDSTNNLRYWSGFAATWSPSAEPDLTIGIGRVVYAVAGSWGDVAARPLQSFLPADNSGPRAATDTVFRKGSDQLFSLFGRWVFPRHGFEAYAEWARAELPRSLRDFLLSPNHSQGYTIGAQWLGSQTSAGRVRVQAEHTYLEQDPTFRDRPLGSFYTSRAVLQGYTNRGQVLGAGIGQGSSGEWISTDVIGSTFSGGFFGQRTRFNNDAYYLLPFKVNEGHCQHDVTMTPGIRASAKTGYGRFSAQFTSAQRMNAFFQNLTHCETATPKIDVRNKTLSVSLILGG
jgi:hypothetical protein